MAKKKIGLTTYGFSVQNDSNERLELNNFEGKNNSFINLLKDYLDGLMSIYETDKKNDTVFLFDKVDIEYVLNERGQKIYSIMYIRVKTGDYGIESELVDSKTGKVSYTRKEDEADVLPFGAAIVVPSGKMDNGIIILQSISRYGVKLSLQKKLDNFVKSYNSEYRLKMGVILPKVMMDIMLKEGILQKIRLIKFSVSADIAERFGLNVGVKDAIEERVIRKPRGFLNNKKKEIDEWRLGQITYDKLIQLENFEYDDLKMEFKLGRTLKTISLKNINDLQVSEDVTEDVKLLGGHPDFESLKKVMKSTAVFYLKAKQLILEE